MNIEINYLTAIFGLIALISFACFIGCCYCLFHKICLKKSPNIVNGEINGHIRRRSSRIVRQTQSNMTMRLVIQPSAPPMPTQQIYSPFRIPRANLPTYDQAIGKRY
jgi:hypothetical protein